MERKLWTLSSEVSVALLSVLIKGNGTLGMQGCDSMQIKITHYPVQILEKFFFSR